MAKPLRTDADLFAAALFQMQVSVIQRTADDIYVEEDKGIIEKITPISVKLNGTYFVRSESEFYVK
ncbi:hypothetical protein [Paenibacillus cremeus]|uniref:Uncharacterized protein n=1 Tax=Paenibacillus cremeus TaxID=2163881 RepID=A0A559K8C2_9BACL|nr:hypothetical protein [Paenibacillus cremeus]TVY08386.1 hypothetical protein FPZ49_19290 [Paenibacillus cremeus]